VAPFRCALLDPVSEEKYKAAKGIAAESNCGKTLLHSAVTFDVGTIKLVLGLKKTCVNLVLTFRSQTVSHNRESVENSCFVSLPRDARPGF
jgi:hypothetical protein